MRVLSTSHKLAHGKLLCTVKFCTGNSILVLYGLNYSSIIKLCIGIHRTRAMCNWMMTYSYEKKFFSKHKNKTRVLFAKYSYYTSHIQRLIWISSQYCVYTLCCARVWYITDTYSRAHIERKYLKNFLLLFAADRCAEPPACRQPTQEKQPEEEVPRGSEPVAARSGCIGAREFAARGLASHRVHCRPLRARIAF